MTCPSCGLGMIVDESRNDNKLGVWRRRRCKGCGLAFTTTESRTDALRPQYLQARSWVAPSQRLKVRKTEKQPTTLPTVEEADIAEVLFGKTPTLLERLKERRQQERNNHD